MIHCLAEGFPDPVIEWKRSTIMSASMNQRSLLSSSSSSTSSSSLSSPNTFKAIAFDGKFLKVESNSSLEIKHIDKSDEGYYMCKATNGLGSVSKMVSLSVKTPAHFKEEFRVETVSKSSPLVITCEALGDKPLSISWKKDGQLVHNPSLSGTQQLNSLDSLRESPSTSSSLSIISDNRYVISESITDQGLTSQIKVESADRRDSSLYTCSCSNAYGSDEINLQVIVQGMFACSSSSILSCYVDCTLSYS